MSINTYLAETRAELRHVNWPSRRQTINYTATVIVLSGAVSLALGAFDLLFNLLLKTVI